MHWGLTRFERKRIERIALDHPFFDMHPQLFTRKELRAVLAQGPRKSGPQVIAEVRKELGMIYAPDCQNQRTFAEALRDATFVPSFRRTVAVVALCLLMIFFMVFTVPGRAFAEELYSVIIDFIDGTLGMRNSMPSSDQSTPDFSMLPDGLLSPQALAKSLRYPIVASSDKLTSFEYEMIGSDVLVIRSKYKTSAGEKYTIVQEVHGSRSYWSADIDVDRNDYQRINSIKGIELYSGTSTDGKTFVVGYSESFSINISGRELTLAEIILVAEHLTLYEE